MAITFLEEPAEQAPTKRKVTFIEEEQAPLFAREEAPIEKPPVEGTSITKEVGLLGPAFKESLGRPLENMGEGFEVVGFQGVANALKGAITEPENYVSAAERFMEPQPGESQFLGFAWQYAPRAAVEQAGQAIGSIATRIAGGIAGAPLGPAGVATGAFVGPAIFEAAQIIGPVAKERARNNGREVPTNQDIVAATITAAGSGALNAIGAKYLPGGEKATGKFFKRVASSFVGEGVTETGQAVTEQVGSTAGTEAGLNINVKQAIGEGLIGGTTGAGLSAITYPLTKEPKNQVIRTPEQAEEIDIQAKSNEEAVSLMGQPADQDKNELISRVNEIEKVVANNETLINALEPNDETRTQLELENKIAKQEAGRLKGELEKSVGLAPIPTAEEQQVELAKQIAAPVEPAPAEAPAITPAEKTYVQLENEAIDIQNKINEEEGVSALIGVSDNAITLSGLESREKGKGTRALEIITQEADKNNTPISLKAESKTGETQRLKEFYMRFGFVNDPSFSPESNRMIRYPNATPAITPAPVAETPAVAPAPKVAPARLYLNVPFNRKEAAKSAGAKFDAEKKLWYIQRSPTGEMPPIAPSFVQEAEATAFSAKELEPARINAEAQLGQEVEIGSFELPAGTAYGLKIKGGDWLNKNINLEIDRQRTKVEPIAETADELYSRLAKNKEDEIRKEISEIKKGRKNPKSKWYGARDSEISKREREIGSLQFGDWGIVVDAFDAELAAKKPVSDVWNELFIKQRLSPNEFQARLDRAGYTKQGDLYVYQPAAVTAEAKPQRYALQQLGATSGEWRTIQILPNKEAADAEQAKLPKGATGWRIIPEPTAAAPAEAAPTGIAVGNRIKLGKSPQTYTIEEVIPQSATERELGEQYYSVKNERTGEVQTVEAKDLNIVKPSKATRKMAPVRAEEEYTPVPEADRYTFKEAANRSIRFFGGTAPENFVIVNDSQNKDYEFKAGYDPDSGEIILNRAYIQKGENIEDILTHELGHYIYSDPQFQADFQNFLESLPEQDRAEIDEIVNEGYNKETNEVQIEERQVIAFASLVRKTKRGRTAWEKVKDVIKTIINRLLKTNIVLSDHGAMAVFNVGYKRFNSGERIIREMREGKLRTAPEGMSKMDRDYLAAVERGDMETAQRMVDEAAKKAGYNIGPVYHGRRTNWTIPNLKAGKIEGDVEAIYFTDNEKLAEEYSFTRFGPRGTKLIQEQEKAEKTLTEILGVTDFSNYHGRLWDNYLLQLNELDISKEEYKRGLNAIETLEEAEQYSNAQDGSPNIVGAFLSYNNKSEVNANRLPMSMINVVVAEKIAAGADLVVVNDAVDPSFEGGNITPSKIYVVSGNEAQIKSADPVTYDDAGNVIPLSQRFRPTSPDIRRMAPEPRKPAAEAKPTEEAAGRREKIMGEEVGPLIKTQDGIIAKTKDKLKTLFDPEKVNETNTSTAYRAIGILSGKNRDAAREYAESINALTAEGLGEDADAATEISMGAALFVNNLFEYAVKLAAKGDRKMLGLMVANINKLPTGQMGASDAGRTLRARVELKARFLLMAQAEQDAFTDYVAEYLFGPNPTPAQIKSIKDAYSATQKVSQPTAEELTEEIAGVGEKTGTDLVKKINDDFTSAAEKDAEARDQELDELSKEYNQVQNKAENEIEKLATIQSDTPSFVQRKKNEIRAIVSSDLKQRPDMGRKAPWKSLLVARLQNAGVSEANAETLADLVWRQHEINNLSRELESINKAIQKGPISEIINQIKDTPIEQQQDPKWRYQVMRDYLRRAGLSMAQAERIAKLMDISLQKRFTEAKEQAFTDAIQRSAPWKNGEIRSKRAFDQMIKAIRAGALDPSRNFISDIAAMNGWTGFTDDQYAKLLKLDSILANPKSSDADKAEAHKEVQNIISKAKLPIRARDIIGQFYDAQALSGIPTITVNMVSPIGMAAKNALVQAASGVATFRPEQVDAAFKTLIDSIKSWVKTVAYSFKNNVTVYSNVEYLVNDEGLLKLYNRGRDQFKNGKTPRDRADGVKNMMIGMWDYVRRILNALDYGAIASLQNQNVPKYALAAMQAKGMSSKDGAKMLNAMFEAKRNFYENQIAIGTDKNKASVLADEFFVSSWRQALTDAKLPAQEVMDAAINDAMSAVGRTRASLDGFRDENTKLQDSGVTSFPALWLLQTMANAANKSDSQIIKIFSRVIYGFAVVPARVFRETAWFSPYGYVRFAYDAIARKKGLNSPYAQSLGSDLQYRQRLTEATAGTLVLLGLASALASSTDDEDDKRPFKIVVTGNGPNRADDPQYYDSWIKNNTPNTVTLKFGKVRIPINTMRGFEAFAWPSMMLGAVDDWKIRRKLQRKEKNPTELGDAAVVAGNLFSAALKRGPYAFAAKPLFEAYGDRTVESLFKSIAFPAKTLIPVIGSSILRNTSDFINDPIDRRTIDGALWANVPFIGPAVAPKALNAFGEPAMAGEAADKLFKLGVPIVFNIPNDRESVNLHELVLKKGGGPSIPTRTELARRLDRDPTNKEFQLFVKEYGSEISRVMKSRYKSLEAKKPEDYDAEVKKIGDKARDRAERIVKQKAKQP